MISQLRAPYAPVRCCNTCSEERKEQAATAHDAATSGQFFGVFDGDASTVFFEVRACLLRWTFRASSSARGPLFSRAST